MKSTKRKVVKHGQSVNLGCFRVEFIKTNHSIADSAALALFTPAGIIVHTGDFKVDYTRYSEMPLICSVLLSWEERVFWRFSVIVQTPSAKALPLPSVRLEKPSMPSLRSIRTIVLS